MLTNKRHAASTETVPMRLREKVRPAKTFLGFSGVAAKELLEANAVGVSIVKSCTAHLGIYKTCIA